MNFLTTTTESYISLFFTLALMLVLLYFMIYRPQKKQEKKDAAMRAALGNWRSGHYHRRALSAAWLPSRTTRSFWRLALTV